MLAPIPILCHNQNSHGTENSLHPPQRQHTEPPGEML